MLKGSFYNTADSMVGYADEIAANRDAILGRQTLSRYAVARITGKPVKWPVEPQEPKVAPSDQPATQRGPASPVGLPQIAAACAGAFHTSIGDMREFSRDGAPIHAVIAATAICRRMTNMRFKEIASFFHRKSYKSAHEWCVWDRRLQEDPIYQAKFDAARRALEACR